MKKLYVAALLALPLLAAPAQASGCGGCGGGCGFGFRVEFGFMFRVSPCCNSGCCGGGGGQQLGPWYNYWPLEAHFITPAPTGYPYWPQPQALMPAPGAANPAHAAASGPDVRPVGYYGYQNYPVYPAYPQTTYYGQAPSYWYSPRP
jgi:hypothetical protein